MAKNTVLDASPDHPALRMKREFVAAQRARRVPPVDAVLARIHDRPTPRLVQDLAGRLRFRRRDMKAALKQLEPFVFGGTPLGLALGHAQAVFEADAGSAETKILFVLSDGEAADTAAMMAACTAMRRSGVIVVACFLTDSPIASPRQLYHTADAGWTVGERRLFDCTSGGFKNTDLPVSLLVQAGWVVPAEGECTLFFRANNLKVVQEFHTIVQTAFVREPVATALGVAAQIDWAMYLRDVNQAAAVQRQHGPTCWAHAVGTVLHHAMKRIVNREGGVPTFAAVRDRCFAVMSRPGHDASEHGADVRAVLDAVKDEYRVRFKEVSEVEARQALWRHRPVVATFRLFDHPDFNHRRSTDPREEWERFSLFFKASPTATAEKDNIQRTAVRPPLYVVTPRFLLVIPACADELWCRCCRFSCRSRVPAWRVGAQHHRGPRGCAHRCRA